MPSTLPRSDSALLAWSLNFGSKISLSPVTYGLSAAQATSYGTVHANYASALAACDPVVRNRTATAAKNTAKAELKIAANQLIDAVNSTPGVTNAEKINIGINIRVKPTPSPVPATVPGMIVMSVNAWTVKIKLYDIASKAKRGRPPGVVAANLFSYVGAVPPAGMGAWQFEGTVGKTTVDVTFPNTVAPGTKVWLSAFWLSGSKKSGPASPPLSTYIQGGSMSMAA